MKTTIKTLAAAVALVTTSGVHALSLTPPGNGTNGSTLILTAFDNTTTFATSGGTETAARGFVVDLGIDLAGFLADPANAFTVNDTSALFNQAFVNVLDGDNNPAPSNPDNIRWNISAGNFGPTTVNNQLLTSTAAGNPLGPVTNAQMQGGITELGQFMNAVNNNDPKAFFTVAGDGQSGDPNPASNHGSNFNGQLGGINNAVGLGEAIDLVLLGITTRFVFGTTTIVPSDPASRTGPFDLGLAPGQFWTLTEDGQFAVVPLPAGVWLLGSALVGLVGFARRRAA